MNWLQRQLIGEDISFIAAVVYVTIIFITSFVVGLIYTIPLQGIVRNFIVVSVALLIFFVITLIDLQGHKIKEKIPYTTIGVNIVIGFTMLSLSYIEFILNDIRIVKIVIFIPIIFFTCLLFNSSLFIFSNSQKNKSYIFIFCCYSLFYFSNIA